MSVHRSCSEHRTQCFSASPRPREPRKGHGFGSATQRCCHRRRRCCRCRNHCCFSTYYAPTLHLDSSVILVVSKLCETCPLPALGAHIGIYLAATAVINDSNGCCSQRCFRPIACLTLAEPDNLVGSTVRILRYTINPQNADRRPACQHSTGSGCL